MYQAILIVHILIAVSIVGLVLMQQGRGADTGAAFGSGASGTVFGARGSASFLSRTTAIMATLFFATSLGLAYLTDTQEKEKDIMEAVEPVQGPGQSDLPIPPDDAWIKEVPGDLPSPSPGTEPASKAGAPRESEIQKPRADGDHPAQEDFAAQTGAPAKESKADMPVAPPMDGAIGE